MKSLPAKTMLCVRTKNSFYFIVVLDPKKSLVVLHGGELLKGPTIMRVQGSTCGDSAVLAGKIRTGLHLEFTGGGKSRFITSVVEYIEIDNNPMKAERLITFAQHPNSHPLKS